MSNELEAIQCGHHASNLDHSVESGVYFCMACRNVEMLRDALVMEARYRSERNTARDAAIYERNRADALALRVADLETRLALMADGGGP